MSELKAAVIGLGVGKGHIEAFREAGAEVAAICDTDEGVLGEVGEKEEGRGPLETASTSPIS